MRTLPFARAAEDQERGQRNAAAARFAVAALQRAALVRMLLLCR